MAEFLDVDVADIEDAIAVRACFAAESLDALYPTNATFPLDGGLIDTGDAAAAAEARVLLQEPLRRLSADDRELIGMRFVEGLTQQEIADGRGTNQMHVSRVLAVLLRRLRTEIGPV